MPKVATPKSSPVKRQQTAGSSPAKLGSPRKQKKVVQVQDRAQWRPSTIPEGREINKSAAIANYHLNANDLQGMPYEKRPQPVKIKGEDVLVPMYCYKEREVELKAWEKHGGPEGFQTLLCDKMAKFYTKHGTNSGKNFRKPIAYTLANDPMASGYVGIMTRPGHLPDTETSTPTLIQIKAQMVARGEKWLWDALNKNLFDVECRTEYGPTFKRGERETMMLCAFQTMRGYPKRPTSPPLDSASFDALKDVLDRAAAVCNELTLDEDDEDLEVWVDHATGSVIKVDWKPWYRREVEECLNSILKEHGVDGWKQARWLVYDKYMECQIGGPKYEEGGWYDTGKPWLHRKLED